MDSGGAVDYAWEEPLLAHRLRICIDSDSVAYKDNVLHEYNLDVIKVSCHHLRGWAQLMPAAQGPSHLIWKYASWLGRNRDTTGAAIIGNWLNQIEWESCV